MKPVPDREYDDNEQVSFMRRSNSALALEALCSGEPPTHPRDGYVPEFGDIRLINPKLTKGATGGNDGGKWSIGDDDWNPGDKRDGSAS